MTNSFFTQHLYEEVKNKYNLSDEELDYILNLTNKYSTADIAQALRQLKTSANPETVRDIVSNLSKGSPTAREVFEPLPLSSLTVPTSRPIRTAGPIYSIPLSEQETKAAEKLRKSYAKLMSELDDFNDFMEVFFSAIDSTDDKENLTTLQPLLRKYQRKLQDKFNHFVKEFGEILNGSIEMFSDRKFDNIRDLLIENVKSMRDSLVELLKLFKDVEDKNFVKSAKQLNQSIKNDIEQINTIIKKQLFQHIDRDYLGKIRLS